MWWYMVHMEEVRYVYILVRKPEETTWKTTYTCRWEDNIRMDLTEIGWEDMNSYGL
jgi:hypothetical protein